MSALTRVVHQTRIAASARPMWCWGGSLLAVAALAACSSPVPLHTNQAGPMGTGTYGAPVVESSMYSDGRLVAAPTPVQAQAPAYAPAGQAPMGTAAEAYAGTHAAAPVDAGAPAAPLSGLHLQAGTFSSQTSAENVAANIRSKLPQFAQQVRVMPRGSNWRVLIGPFASDAERAQAATAIRTGIGSDVVNAAP